MKKVFDENPGWRLLSKSKLVSTLKLSKIKVPRSEIDGHFKSSSLNQVFKKRPKAPSFRITAMPYSFQIDVVKTLDDAQFLLLVDIMSRKAFGYMMPSGKMADVIEKYEVFKRDAGHHIVSVSGDAFFDNKAFKEVCAARFTSVYTSVAKDNHGMHAGNKLGIIDRAVRTLKMYISKQRIEEDGWAFLTDVIDLYNSTPHSSLDNRPPNDVYNDVPYMVKRHFENDKYNRSVKLKLHSKFKIGDKVRIFVGKDNVFTKERQSYSKEIYTIEKEEGNVFVIQGLSRRYMARDLQKIEAEAVAELLLAEATSGLQPVKMLELHEEVAASVKPLKKKKVKPPPKRELRDRSSIRKPCWYKYKELVKEKSNHMSKK